MIRPVYTDQACLYWSDLSVLIRHVCTYQACLYWSGLYVLIRPVYTNQTCLYRQSGEKLLKVKSKESLNFTFTNFLLLSVVYFSASILLLKSPLVDNEFKKTSYNVVFAIDLPGGGRWRFNRDVTPAVNVPFKRRMTRYVSAYVRLKYRHPLTSFIL